MGLVEQLQQYQEGNGTQLSIGDLNEMVEEVNKNLTCDEECQRQTPSESEIFGYR